MVLLPLHIDRSYNQSPAGAHRRHLCRHSSLHRCDSKAQLTSRRRVSTHLQPHFQISSIAGRNENRRKTVFKGFTFHFLDPSSPYTEIVPLAGGQIDRTSLTYASQASSPLASHIVVFPSEESPELSSEASVTLKRPLSEAAAAWARRGWLPLAEQELMRALVFDGEMQRLVAGARRRWEEEMRERESVGLASDDSVETVESQSSVGLASDDSVETVESQSSVQQLSVKQSLMQRS